MTSDNVQLTFARRDLLARVDLYFAGIGQGVNAGLLRRGRLAQIAALDANSDAELTRMGLRRDDIVAHVFRDLFSAR